LNLFRNPVEGFADLIDTVRNSANVTTEPVALGTKKALTLAVRIKDDWDVAMRAMLSISLEYLTRTMTGHPRNAGGVAVVDKQIAGMFGTVHSSI
jgi:hypothetical protein